MHPSFVVAAAVVIGCFLPAAVVAQGGAGSEDLRTEIRRIVREEIHAALQEMHGGQATPHAVPDAPVRAMVDAQKAAPRAGNKAKAAEKIDSEVQQMNVLIEQIEQEVAKNEHNLQRLGVMKRSADARPKAKSEGEAIQLQLDDVTVGGEGMQIHLGEGGEGLHLQLGEGGEGGMHTFVIEDGEIRALGGDAKKIKVGKIAAPKKVAAPKKDKKAAAKPSGDGVFQIELQQPQGKAKNKNKGKAGGDKPVELRLENVEMRMEGGDDGQVLMVPGQPAGKAGKAGCECDCQCCGGAKGMTATQKAPSPHVMFLGEPVRGEAGKGKTQVRAKGGDDDDDDDDDDDGEEARQVAPPKKAAKAKPGQPQLMILGEPVHGEAGKGKTQVRAKGGDDDDDDDDDGEEAPKALPPGKANPAPAVTPAKPRVIRLGLLLV